MKKAFLIIPVLSVLLAGCQQYDDSKISGTLSELDSRVGKIEEMYNQIKRDMSQLSTLVGDLQKHIYVKTLTSTDTGWLLVMTDGTSMDITKGSITEGDAIGVKKDADNIYYWTLNGEFLLAGGRKVPVYSEAVTLPSFKIGNAILYVSYDGGKTWQEIGVTGKEVVPAVSDIQETETGYVLVLSKGGSITLPKALPLTLTVEAAATMRPGETVAFPYTLTGADESTEVAAMARGNWMASSEPATVSSGLIRVTAPKVWEDGMIVVLAANRDRSVMSVIQIMEGEEAPVITVETGSVSAPGTGTILSIPVTANFQPVISCEADWITLTETRSDLAYTLTVLANPNEEARSADVLFQSPQGATLATLHVDQAAGFPLYSGWNIVSEWPIQGPSRCKYYTSSWPEHSPYYGLIQLEGAGTILFDHSGSIAAGTTNNQKGKISVSTSSAYQQYDPHVYGTWEGDNWVFESLTGAQAGDRVSVHFQLAGSPKCMGYWMLEYLDGTEWKPAAPVLSVYHRGVEKEYTHRITEERLYTTFEGEGTLSAPVRQITFRATAVTTFVLDGETELQTVAEGGDGSSGWMLLCARSDEDFPHISIYR